jgi:hypothetical protein
MESCLLSLTVSDISIILLPTLHDMVQRVSFLFCFTGMKATRCLDNKMSGLVNLSSNIELKRYSHVPQP